MTQTCIDFLDFLKKSPSVYHAADEIVHRLKHAGFSEIKETDKWKLLPGHSYFIVRDGSLVTAFRIPKNTPTSTVILATHIDSPCLKLKPHTELFNQKIGQLNTEVYGAPLLHTWLDRDLMIAGKITFLDETNQIQSKTIQLRNHPVIIPNLALHLDRNIMEKGALVHKQDHLKAIFSLNAKENDLEKAIKQQASFKKLLSTDLFLVPSEAPSFVGFNDEMIASARLDNLTSAYAACEAICKAKPPIAVLQMAFFWDHEEIGSVSTQGADSIFATDLLERISLSLKIDAEDLYRMKARSLCLSGDLAHGYHPNFTDKFDPQNAPFLGRGVVLKFNANQKYATSSATATTILLLAEKHNIPIQKFASRSDIPSGSTVGSMMAAMTGIPTVDLGISSWAMHSIRETISSQDELSLCNLFQKALEEVE